MRIGIDAHMIGSRETGNETYCLGLVEGLSKLRDGNQYVVYLSSKETLIELDDQPNFERRVLAHGSSVWRLAAGYAQASRIDKLDLLHVTYNTPLFTKCPQVVAVHDISYAHFPEFFSKRDLRLLSKYVPYSVRSARHVLTLSQSAADDIANVYGVPREKLTVVPLAARKTYTHVADPALVGEVRERFGLAGPYILAVGNLQPRKNLSRLVEAFAQLPRSLRDLKLVLVGKAQWQQSQVYERVKDLNLEDRVVFTGYVTDDELALLYHSSQALVYPSLYEGFGLPILEAMACGTPVICSNTSSMPEVAGDAALLIDPLNVGEMSEAIAQVAGSGSVRAELAARGLRRNAQFTWQETARQTANVYEKVVEDRAARVVTSPAQ